ADRGGNQRDVRSGRASRHGDREVIAAVKAAIGILGLGPAGRAMAPYVEAHRRFQLAAVCDVRSEALPAFEARTDVARFTSIDAMCAAADIDAIFVATPTWLHATHVIRALDAGKHVVVEKPMAVSAAESQAMIAASDRAGRTLVVGHSQSFEPGCQVMRAIIASGQLGALKAINALNYTDWMFRPRLPAEFDRAQGGGTVYRQAAHQIDIVRYLVGGAVPRTVRATIGDWDRERRGDGAFSAFMQFETGCTASLFYSGYDHLQGTELTFGISETGRRASYEYAIARKQLRAGPSEAAGAAKYAPTARQSELIKTGSYPAFFGLIIASCERGDLRLTPEGVQVNADWAQCTIGIDGLPQGREPVLDELADAIAGRPATHDARWGAANLDVCLAMIASSDARAEVSLPEQTDRPIVMPEAIAQRVEGELAGMQ
ncbi:MAG: Gfo/Idh/MocA family protein, partial [Burkholderiales bacterium]